MSWEREIRVEDGGEATARSLIWLGAHPRSSSGTPVSPLLSPVSPLLSPVRPLLSRSHRECGSVTVRTAVTLPGQSITLPGQSVTLPGQSVTLHGPTVTLPGPTVKVVVSQRGRPSSL